MARAKKYFTQTNDELNQLIKDSISKAEVLKKLKVSNPSGGGWYRLLNRYIKTQNIDTSHFLGAGWAIGKKLSGITHIPDHEVFIQNSSFGKIRKRFLKFAIKNSIPYCCQKCSLDSWNGHSITLQVDHINGDHCDNRTSNLRFLCPNCHSQTNTFGSKNPGCIQSKNQYARRDLNPQHPLSKNGLSAKLEYERIINHCAFCQSPCSSTKKFCSTKCYHDSCRAENGGSRPSTRKASRPEKTTLEQEIKTMTMVSLGAKYGVSDNAVRKWCKSYGIQL